jgi:hypothetical protein
LLQRFGRFNVVGEEAFVIKKTDFNSSSTRKKKFTRERTDFLNIDCPSPDDLDTAVDSEDILSFPPTSLSKPSKEEGVVAVDPLYSKKLLEGILLKYQQSEAKLRREMVAILLDDNLWHLKSWDANDLDKSLWMLCKYT